MNEPDLSLFESIEDLMDTLTIGGIAIACVVIVTTVGIALVTA